MASSMKGGTQAMLKMAIAKFHIPMGIGMRAKYRIVSFRARGRTFITILIARTKEVGKTGFSPDPGRSSSLTKPESSVSGMRANPARPALFIMSMEMFMKVS